MAAEKTVSRKAIAKALKVDERTITNLRRRYADFPVRVKGRSVTFPIRRCKAWYAAHLKEQQAAREKSEAPSALREIEERSKRAQMLVHEANAAARIAELLPSQAVREEVASVMAGLRSAIDAMPQQHAHRILHKTNVIDAAAALREIAFHLLGSLRTPRFNTPEQSAPGAR